MKRAEERATAPPPLGELTESLRRQARRVTGPRQAILGVLRTHRHPLSTKEIFAALRPGACDLATVYRSTRLLEDMSLIKRYDFGDGVARFEIVRPGDPQHHHHLVCTRCAAVVEIDDCLAANWERRLARQSGYRTITHKLEFFGICPRCQ